MTSYRFPRVDGPVRSLRGRPWVARPRGVARPCAARIAVVIVVAACRTSAPAPPRDLAGDETIERRVQAGDATFVFRAGATANLVFQLDCLAGLIPCSKDVFDKAWHASGWTEDDDAALTMWTELRGRYSGDIEDASVEDAETALPLPPRRTDVATRIRVASFGTRDREHYLDRLALFAAPADVVTARTILERFAPRALATWRSTSPQLRAAIDRYAKLAARPDMTELMTQIAHLLDARGALTAPQVFELVARPPGGDATRAEQLGSVGVVEVLTGAQAESMFPVIAHEMFHAWFASSPLERQRALVEQFLATGDPLAVPAWALLDEAVATALGNGFVQRAVDEIEYARTLAAPQGFYTDPEIDAVAKRLLPDLQARLARRGTIFDPDFATIYLRSLRDAFPRGLPQVAKLRMMACVFDPSLGKSYEKLLQVTRAGHAYCTSELSRAGEVLDVYPRLGSILLLTPASLTSADVGALGLDPPVLATLRQRAAREDVLAETTTRTGAARFVLIAKDDAAMAVLLDKLAVRPD